MIISNKIYLNFIIFIIVLSSLLSGYIYLNYNLDSHTKILFIWFVIILELNLIHLYIIINFYEKNKNKKGIQGPKGENGPKGFIGKNQLCMSCGSAGSKNDEYGGVINDNKNQVNDPSNKLVPGKCIFPFLHEHKYHSECITTKTPLETNDANNNGWCATKVDDDYKPITFGYCNPINQAKENSSKDYLKNRQTYIQNNYGILDVIAVEGNTENDAKQKCFNHGDGQYKIYQDVESEEPLDFNKNADGKFIYLCYKDGIGGKGISNINIGKKCSEFLDNDEENCDKNTYCKFDTNKCKTKNIFKRDPINLNNASTNNQDLPELFLFKQYSNSKFIKDFNISSSICNDGYDIKNEDLNFGRTPPMKLCVNKTGDNIISIDSAFVYKDKRLYIFRGSKFYKISKIPIQGSLTVEDGYPKYISQKWIKSNSSNNNNLEDCSIHNDNEDDCNSFKDKCFFDPIASTNSSTNPSKKGFCEPKLNYNAVFTYNYNKKTYFFKGNNVYLYDDEKMTVSDGYPKPINSVFKGIPNNIDAVFTWGKDKKTYFFKGKYYYKYNDKQKRAEKGYPKLITKRWPKSPDMINAIFTLDIPLDNEKDNHPTYIISGGKIYYIDALTDNVKLLGQLNNKITKLDSLF